MTVSLLNLRQPAKDWLADVLEVLAAKEKAGEYPELDITICGLDFEFRLKPQSISIPNPPHTHDERKDL